MTQSSVGKLKGKPFVPVQIGEANVGLAVAYGRNSQGGRIARDRTRDIRYDHRVTPGVAR